MENENRPQSEDQRQRNENNPAGKVTNPFENHQPVEQDIQQSQEELEKEQQFKEAQTERD